MNNASKEKHVTLNRPALWKAIPGRGIGARVYTSNRTFLENGAVSYPTAERPITRYVQSFTKGKKDFSLFMFSDEADSKKVSRFFDNVIKNTKVEDVSKAIMTASSDGFTYLDTEYKENK